MTNTQKQISYWKTSFRMARARIPKTVRKEIERFVRSLEQDGLLIDSVFLFGSYAKGRQRRGSDIDVCILSQTFNDSFDALQYLWRKRALQRGSRIQPIGFHPRDFREESSLTHEIKKTGVRMM